MSRASHLLACLLCLLLHARRTSAEEQDGLASTDAAPGAAFAATAAPHYPIAELAQDVLRANPSATTQHQLALLRAIHARLPFAVNNLLSGIRVDEEDPTGSGQGSVSGGGPPLELHLAAGLDQDALAQAHVARILARREFRGLSSPVECAATGDCALLLHGQDSRTAARQEAVRRAFQHAWRGYERYAFGQDVLQPLSRTGKRHLVKMGETLVDCLDSLLLMGEPGQYARAREWVRSSLVFGGHGQQDINTFETTIRVVGGLLAAHDLSSDPLFLERARELVDRMVDAGAFDSPTGLPYGTLTLYPDGGGAGGEGGDNASSSDPNPGAPRNNGNGPVYSYSSAVSHGAAADGTSAAREAAEGEAAVVAAAAAASIDDTVGGAVSREQPSTGAMHTSSDGEGGGDDGKQALQQPASADNMRGEDDRTAGIVATATAEGAAGDGGISNVGGSRDAVESTSATGSFAADPTAQLQPAANGSQPQQSSPPESTAAAHALAGPGVLGTRGHSYNPQWASGFSSTAEAATLGLELETLSARTGDPFYAWLSRRITAALARVGVPQGLFPIMIDPASGHIVDTVVSMGARGDSTYEYFLKGWMAAGGWEVEGGRAMGLAPRALGIALRVRAGGASNTSVHRPLFPGAGPEAAATAAGASTAQPAAYAPSPAGELHPPEAPHPPPSEHSNNNSGVPGSPEFDPSPRASSRTLLRLYNNAVCGIMDTLLQSSSPSRLLYVAEMRRSPAALPPRTCPLLDHKVDQLTCFLPGVLALGAHNGAGHEALAREEMRAAARRAAEGAVEAARVWLLGASSGPALGRMGAADIGDFVGAGNKVGAAAAARDENDAAPSPQQLLRLTEAHLCMGGCLPGDGVDAEGGAGDAGQRAPGDAGAGGWACSRCRTPSVAVPLPLGLQPLVGVPIPDASTGEAAPALPPAKESAGPPPVPVLTHSSSSTLHLTAALEDPLLVEDVMFALEGLLAQEVSGYIPSLREEEEDAAIGALLLASRLRRGGRSGPKEKGLRRGGASASRDGSAGHAGPAPAGLSPAPALDPAHPQQLEPKQSESLQQSESQNQQQREVTGSGVVLVPAALASDAEVRHSSPATARPDPSGGSTGISAALALHHARLARRRGAAHSTSSGSSTASCAGSTASALPATSPSAAAVATVPPPSLPPAAAPGPLPSQYPAPWALPLPHAPGPAPDSLTPDPLLRTPFCGPGGIQSPEEARRILFHTAHELARTCVEMARRTTTGLAPEIVTFSPGKDFAANKDASHALLRPETVESLFVLTRLRGGHGAPRQWGRVHTTAVGYRVASQTAAEASAAGAAAVAQYRDWAWDIFDSFERHARVRGGGYASVENVNAWPLSSGVGRVEGVLDPGAAFNYSAGRANQRDSMESFYLAETLKYLFLIYEDGGGSLSLDEWVFNTEAHPLRIAGAAEARARAAVPPPWEYWERRQRTRG